jgi:hypothetical protein
MRFFSFIDTANGSINKSNTGLVALAKYLFNFVQLTKALNN